MAYHVMALHEAAIIVPKHPAEMPHRDLEEAILTFAGGFTKTAGHGAWRNDRGEIESEPVAVYTFAVGPGTLAQITSLAVWACIHFNQQALYVRYPDGTVNILDREFCEDYAERTELRTLEAKRARDMGRQAPTR